MWTTIIADLGRDVRNPPLAPSCLKNCSLCLHHIVAPFRLLTDARDFDHVASIAPCPPVRDRSRSSEEP